MEACVCIDYLSHEWSDSDLIQVYRELRRQRSKTMFDLITNKGKKDGLSKKELKKLNSERSKQTRYQNTIWRQMTRSCTRQLGHTNQMIHPSQLNWQKEADITWLYGPLFMPPNNTESTTPNMEQYPTTHPSLSFLLPKKTANSDTAIFTTDTDTNTDTNSTTGKLKSALKKAYLPNTTIMLQKDYWLTNDRYWSKTVSESGKQNVRFNPDIFEVKFLSETPVKQLSFTSATPIALDDEEDEEDELYKVISQVCFYIKSTVIAAVLARRDETSSHQASLLLDVFYFFFGIICLITNRTLGIKLSLPSLLGGQQKQQQSSLPQQQ